MLVNLHATIFTDGAAAETGASNNQRANVPADRIDATSAIYCLSSQERRNQAGTFHCRCITMHQSRRIQTRDIGRASPWRPGGEIDC